LKFNPGFIAALKALEFPHDLLRSAGIVPEPSVRGFGFQSGYTLGKSAFLKDASGYLKFVHPVP